MEFKNWLVNLQELANGPVKGMIDAAMNMIWKVIYIPDRPVVSIQEQVQLDTVRSMFHATSMTPFYSWIETYTGSFEPGRGPDKITNGSVGYCAFFGNHVVKFTDQRSEAEIAALLGDHKIPNVAILDVKRIPKSGMWVIMQEKVQTADIPVELQEAAIIVGDWVDKKYAREQKSPFDKARSPKVVNDELFTKYPVEEYGWVCHAYAEMILELIQQIEKRTGRVWNDADPANVGLKGGKAALFDLGFNYPSRRKKVPVIRDI
jgi:hypothetical protein